MARSHTYPEEHLPQRHKDAPPEEDLYAPIEWQSAGEYGDILYEKADGIAKITINRPEVLNAFRPQTLIDVSAALERAREDPEVGVIVFTGAGQQAFCSGGDQTVRGDTGYIAEGASIGRFHVTDLQVQMRRLPKPVVAMVAGYAIGGGHILHVCCDLTIAADNAVFGQTGPRVGSWDGGFGASPAARPGRDQEGEGVLAAVPPVRRRGGAGDGPGQRRRPARSTSKRETVAWCRDMLALSPFALRLVKASFNAHEDGYAGIQQLAHDANLLFYGTRRPARAARPSRRNASRTSPSSPAAHEDLADGGAAADAAGGDRAGPGRHRGGGRSGSGTCRAGGAFFAALVGSIFIQIGTNLANDYSDAKRGADTADRLGPVRVTSAGLVTPQRVLTATWIAFAVAVACGIYLATVAGVVILVIGVFSIAAGVLYTGGPRPYGYAGLGEVFVFLFFGLVAVNGSYYVQLEHARRAAAGALDRGRLPRHRDPRRQQRPRPRDRPAGRQDDAGGADGPRANAVNLYRLLVLGAFVVLPIALGRRRSERAAADRPAGAADGDQTDAGDGEPHRRPGAERGAGGDRRPARRLQPAGHRRAC